ncbi:MAG: MFS transporter [Rhodococcus sp. (in: high G+C Gram-positive bacteria)]
MNRTQRATLAVLTVGVAAFSLAQSLLIPELGPLARELGTDQSTVTWLLTAYLISASVATPIAGRLGDIMGKDRALVISLALLAVGSLIGALAPNVGWMIVARALQGAGGGVLPLSFGIIRDVLPPARVAQAIGVTSSLLTVGIGGGIVLAGPLVGAFGFSWLFWAPFIVCSVGAVAAARVIPRSPTRTSERIKPLPAVLLAGWLLLLLVPVSRASVWGWTSPAVLVSLVGAVAVFGMWARTELRAEAPLVDLRTMRTRSVWTAHAIAFLIGFGLYSSSTLIPQFLQTPAGAGYGFGVTSTQSGLMLIPQCLFSFAAGIMAARAAHGFGNRAVIIAGALLAAIGTSLLAVVGGSLLAVYAGTTLIGLGTGLTMALLANLVVAAVPAEQTGAAAGTNANLRTIGGAIGAAVLTTVVTAQSADTGQPSAAGYAQGFLIIAALLAVAAVVGLQVPAATRRGSEAVNVGKGTDNAPTPHSHAADHSRAE